MSTSEPSSSKPSTALDENPPASGTDDLRVIIQKMIKVQVHPLLTAGLIGVTDGGVVVIFLDKEGAPSEY